jgi:hypothetical protein
MGILSDLLKHLQNGEVTFEFRTTEGKIRKSRGTLNQNMIPRDEWAKGASIKRPGPKLDELSVRIRKFQPFYDLEISQWRRFKPMNLIRIISSKPSRNFGRIKPDVEEDEF